MFKDSVSGNCIHVKQEQILLSMSTTYFVQIRMQKFLYNINNLMLNPCHWIFILILIIWVTLNVS